MTLSASSILIHYRNPAMSVQTILHILSTLIATSSMPVAVCVFVPTHLREVGGGGEELYTQMGSVNFGRSI